MLLSPENGRESLLIMEFKFSKHAELELQRRGLEKSRIEAVLREPEQKTDERDGLSCFQSRLADEQGKIYLVRVIVNPRQNPNLVVTAYQTSKVSKYWKGFL